MQSIIIRGASDSALAEVENGALKARRYGEWEKAVADGRAFSWSNATYDYTAKDTILAVENNSATHDLKIERIIITGSTATQFVVHAASGVTMAGTAVTGVNLNRNSGLAADATAIGDETGNAGADTYTYRLITGRFANNGIVDLSVDGAIVLPNDHMIGIDFTTDGTAANCTIWGYYVER
jgi:hypothetical protein